MKMRHISSGGAGMRLESGKSLDSNNNGRLNNMNGGHARSSLGFELSPIRLRSGGRLCNKKDHSVAKTVKTKCGQSLRNSLYDSLNHILKNRFASNESSFCTLTGKSGEIQHIGKDLASKNISHQQEIYSPKGNTLTIVPQSKDSRSFHLKPFECVTPKSKTPLEIQGDDGSTYVRTGTVKINCADSKPFPILLFDDQINSDSHIETFDNVSYTVATYCKVVLDGTGGSRQMLLTPTKVKHIKELPTAMEQMSQLATTKLSQNFVVPAEPPPLEKRKTTQQQIMQESAKNATSEAIGNVISNNELTTDIKISHNSIEALKWLITGDSKGSCNVAEYDFQQKNNTFENPLVKKEWTHLRSFRNGGNKNSQNKDNLVGDTAANNTWELAGEIVVSELAKTQHVDLNMEVSSLCLPERHVSCKKFWVIDNPETQKMVDIQFISGMPLPPTGISIDIFLACLSRGLLNHPE